MRTHGRAHWQDLAQRSGTWIMELMRIDMAPLAVQGLTRRNERPGANLKGKQPRPSW